MRSLTKFSSLVPIIIIFAFGFRDSKETFVSSPGAFPFNIYSKSNLLITSLIIISVIKYLQIITIGLSFYVPSVTKIKQNIFHVYQNELIFGYLLNGSKY